MLLPDLGCAKGHDIVGPQQGILNMEVGSREQRAQDCQAAVHPSQIRSCLLRCAVLRHGGATPIITACQSSGRGTAPVVRSVREPSSDGVLSSGSETMAGQWGRRAYVQ